LEGKIVKTRRALGVTLTAALLAACGGQAEPAASAPQAARSGITITLTDSACTAEGLGDVLPQQFAAAVVNTTSSRGAFNLHRLNDGHAYAELDAWIQARQRAIAAGGDVDAMPPMNTIILIALVAAGERDTLDGKLSPGTYGLVCRRDSDSGPPAKAIYLHGPFRVD
jgi:hypothetical protein